MTVDAQKDLGKRRADGCLRWVVLLGLLVMFLVVVLSVVYHYADRYRYRPSDGFVAHRWLGADLKYRYSVLPYVAENIVGVGMTKADVRQLLGEPDRFAGDGSGNEWQYYARPSGFFIRGFLLWGRIGLYLKFDASDRVELIGQDRYFGALNQ